MKQVFTKIKNFFHIEGAYEFEWNDLRAVITVLNVVLIMIFGLSIAWFGLVIAAVGVIKDLIIDRRISGLVMHLANVVLNLYFILAF